MPRVILSHKQTKPSYKGNSTLKLKQNPLTETAVPSGISMFSDNNNVTDIKKIKF